MENNLSDIISFDILLKSAGTGRFPHVGNIDLFRPPPGNIEKCHRWLASKGVTCHPTEFGLVCGAPAGLFEILFSTKVKRNISGSGTPSWECISPPRLPPEIEEYVEQITISAPPEWH
jgi:hypothetical protein